MWDYLFRKKYTSFPYSLVPMVTHLSLSVREVTTPVVVQSRSLIPALLLPPADPAGAKPRRDHRFLDRVSRHEVPKTPGNDDAFKVYDPARVSHIPVSQSVRHPSGVAGSLATPDPRVVGATPLDPGLKSGHPCRGASPTYPLLAPTGGAPLAGARSIGIGHPRSGDRCTAPLPYPLDPLRVAEQVGKERTRNIQ